MISALILAAGQSKRMGQPKMLLPWGNITVLEKVIGTFKAAGVDDILVVTGGARDHVERLIGDSTRTIFNPDYKHQEMLSSIQCGLRTLLESLSTSAGNMSAQATLIGLGDQPQVQERSVRLILEAYAQSGTSLIVPSFQMRRGHPWLVERPLWDEILQMGSSESPRDFLNRHASEIQYVNIDNDSILQDLDTPDDYLKLRP